MKSFPLGLLAVILIAAGCSSTLKVEDISETLQNASETAPPAATSPTVETKPVSGLPFRVPNVYTVRIYQKQRDGSYQAIEPRFVEVLPDPEKLYAINVDAEWLTKQTLDVELNNDGTLKMVYLHGVEFRGDEALEALGSQASAIFEAVENRELNELAAQKAALDAQKELLDAQKNLLAAESALEDAQDKPADDLDVAMVAALEALHAANAAFDAFELLPATATAIEIRAAERALQLARIKANQAYRQADLPAPFPDVGFP